MTDVFDPSRMGNYDAGLVDRWGSQAALYEQAPGVALPPEQSSFVSGSPPSTPNAGGFSLPGGIGMWSSIAGGLTNSIADAIEGYTEQKRYREASKAAGDADMAQAFMRMAAYIQDQQALSQAINEAGAAKAFDPEGTGAAGLQAAGAPLADAAREIVGGTGGVM